METQMVKASDLMVGDVIQVWIKFRQISKIEKQKESRFEFEWWILDFVPIQDSVNGMTVFESQYYKIHKRL